MSLHKGKPPWFLLIVLISGIVLVAFQQTRTQIIERHDIIRAATKANRFFVEETIPAKRGNIFASDGRALALTSESYVFGINPRRVPISPAMWNEVQEITGVSAAEFMDSVTHGRTVGEWDYLLTTEQAIKLQQVKAKYRADGLWVKRAGGRSYPLGSFGAPIIGYIENDKGKAGLERTFDKQLRGQDGVIVGLTDSDGRFLPGHILREESKPIQHGQEITLTIKTDLQIATMRSLTAACEKHRADHGSAVVLDPRTGDILALASWPTYDPIRYKDAQAEVLKGKRSSPESHVAVSHVFEPGSTFKLFTVALGMETGIINDSTRVNCSGKKQFSSATIHCAGDHKPKAHGLVSKDLCIEASCNVTAATWGVQIGFERYSKLIEKLGLLNQTNIGLKPEQSGLLNYKDWNKTIQMANLGFGQSINATPLALASAYSVFANHGKRSTPRLIKAINGKETPIKNTAQLFSEHTCKEMLRMMKLVIQGEHGTGKSLRIPGFTLAGKTGTAQKLDAETIRSGKREYVSSFIGYVPADEPQAVILVMIDNPKQGGYYGGVVAGPVFKDIAMFLIRNLNLRPNEKETHAL